MNRQAGRRASSKPYHTGWRKTGNGGKEVQKLPDVKELETMERVKDYETTDKDWERKWREVGAEGV